MFLWHKGESSITGILFYGIVTHNEQSLLFCYLGKVTVNANIKVSHSAGVGGADEILDYK